MVLISFSRIMKKAFMLVNNGIVRKEVVELGRFAMVDKEMSASQPMNPLP